MVGVSKKKVRVLPLTPPLKLKGYSMSNERMVREAIATVCNKIITEPEAILGQLTSDAMKFQKFSEQLNDIAKTIEDGSDANVRRQLKNTMVVARDLCKSQLSVLALLHVYMLGGNVQADAGKAAMTVGIDGEDVLRAMLAQKFKN